MQTTEEVINFIANNTYIDGKSLNHKFPGIQDWLTQAKAEADAKQEAFNLDQIRAPITMQRRMASHNIIFEAPQTLQYCTNTGECYDMPTETEMYPEDVDSDS